MNQDLRRNKNTIRGFLRSDYSDTNLTEILDLARAGLLFHSSCCCIAGIPKRDHAAINRSDISLTPHVYRFGTPEFERDRAASLAFAHLHSNNALIVPIVLAEIKRRRQVMPESADVGEFELRRTK